MRSYLLLVTPLLTLQAVAGPVFGRLVDPSSSPVKCARVEMICGSDSVAVDTDLAGYFRLDFDSPGFATPTASQGHALGPASPNVFSQTMPSHIFCDLKITASGFRERVVVTEPHPNGYIGSITLQPIHTPAQWSVSRNNLSAPRTAVSKLEKARRYAAKKQFDRAEDELKKAVSAYDRYGLAWAELGYLQLIRSRPEDAIVSFQAALRAGEKTPGLYYGLAYAYAQSGQRAESAKWANMAANLQGGRSDVRRSGR